MNFLYYLLLLLIFIAPHLKGQQINVLNYLTGEPIENVAIYNRNKTKSTLTNQKGKADITMFNDNDSLYFQHTSYNNVIITKEQILENDYRIALRKRNILIKDIVISFNKLGEDKNEIPHMVDVITSEKVKSNTAQNSADILLSTGNVSVQKSQGGGGSPVIRGFEANKILLVIDGVRMNNAIYRSGHLQNSITIDKNILDRTEIIYGPNSTVYGSDALGGTVHYYTKDPALATEEDKNLLQTNMFTQFSSANKGKIYHFDFNTGTRKIGSLTSITLSDFGNIRMGKIRAPFLDDDYGKNLHIVRQYEGNDSTEINPNPDIQMNTGYKQYDFLQKFKYSPADYLNLLVNIQYSTSSDIPRYDQLNLYKGKNLKYAEWYYGPQNRILTSLKSVLKISNPLFTTFSSIFAFQNIEEDRITRKFGDENEISQEEDVFVYSIDLDFFKLHNQQFKTNYGIEFVHNKVYSQAFRRNILNNSLADTITRYPDKGNNTFDLSAYVTNKWKITSKYILSGGIRFNYSHYRSKFEYNSSFYNLPFSDITQENKAITGSLSLVYLPVEDLKLNLILSSGYRNPNIDDYGKIREKSGDLMIPNNNLKPEYSYNGEIGLSKTIDGYIQINGSFFFGFLNNTIVRTPAILNGASVLMFEDDTLRLIKNDNAEEAIIYGTSLNIISDLNSNISFKATLNYTYGKNFTDTLPLSHIPPIYGITSISYDIKKFYNEIYLVYNGWKNMRDMNPYGEDNIDFATNDGFPGWFTINLKSIYRINKNLSLLIAVENILDTFYIPFASGVAAPGRNFIATVRIKI
jgi:hemoglobin/transferrin/lactoferrin receptor protein